MAENKDDLEVVRGSGNVFRDLGHAEADAEQLKSVLAAEIIGIMDARRLTTRGAQKITGVAAADFSRIRQAKLDRFTIDRLMAVLARLDQKVDISVSIRPQRRAALSA
jgi:predicted XRE-type DNA-binding protein